MDREGWRAVIHGVAKSQTRLSDWTELNWKDNDHILKYNCSFIIIFLKIKYNFFKLFFFFWLSWVFVALHELSLVVANWCYSSLRWLGCSLWRLLPGAQVLGALASGVAVQGLSNCGLGALEGGLSVCSPQTQLLCGMWNFPRSEIETRTPALAGGFLSTAPPGMSLKYNFSTKFPVYVQISSVVLCSKFLIQIWNQSLQSSSLDDVSLCVSISFSLFLSFLKFNCPETGWFVLQSSPLPGDCWLNSYSLSFCFFL